LKVWLAWRSARASPNALLTVEKESPINLFVGPLVLFGRSRADKPQCPALELKWDVGRRLLRII